MDTNPENNTPIPSNNTTIPTAFNQLPLYFIENQGQMDEEVAYYVKGSNKILYFTSEGITFALTGNEGGETKRWGVKLSFVGANPAAKPEGRDRQKAIFSHFKGKPKDWITGIPTYKKLAYKDLWPGIDLVYSGMVNQLKYEFVVAPGAEPAVIRLVYAGATDVTLTEPGALTVTTPVGGVEDGVPYAYQVVDGEEKEVSMCYALNEKTEDDVFCLEFDLGEYDPKEQLILDPSMLVYCGYIGGADSFGEAGYAFAVDDQGNAYVTGITHSNQSTFPVKTGPDLTFNGGVLDAFVAKVNAQGTELDYCGYIGGIGDEYGWGIAVDGQGNAYVSGYTDSTESSFPVTVGPDLTFNGGEDVFVAKVNAQGTSLDYCGYIGGIGYEDVGDIAVDGQGRVYVAGCTGSDEKSFPVILGPDLTYNSGGDAFVAKVNAQGSGLIYCGYIGGKENDAALGIVIDNQGNSYVSGQTFSNESSFPVTVGPDLSHNGGNDSFVAKINAQGTGLDYCGYIGGDKGDYSTGIAVDGQGSVYVTGNATSDESSFPVTVGPDLTHNGGIGDVFVAKVNVQGTGLEYCGYIGGSGALDKGFDIDVNLFGEAFVTGYTTSDELSFPVTVGPDLSHNGGQDVFVAKVNIQGTGLDYCGYIGGYGWDNGLAIAVDDQGNAYVTGWTDSTESSFPVKVGPDLTFNGGNQGDAFVAKIMRLSLSADSYELSESTGGTINFTLDAGDWNANRNYFLLGSISGTEPGIPLPGGMATLPLNWDFFLVLVINMINGPIFQNFAGSLDADGLGTATFNFPAGTGATGLSMYYAYALSKPYDFTSNSIMIQIVP
jgi:hypothetical protein